MHKIFLLAFAFLLCSSCKNISAQQKSIVSVLKQADFPDNQAYQRAMDFLSHINTGKWDEIKNYLAINANPSLHSSTAFFVRILHDAGRLSALSIEKSDDPFTANILLSGENLRGMYLRYRLSIDESPQHKIKSANIQLEDSPKISEKIDSNEAIQELGVFFRKICDADVFSGAILLAKEDTILYMNACGPANIDFGVPNKIDTRFNLASMNKMFTAIAIGQLVEQGKLSFDDPISKFGLGFLDEQSAKTVKISHLLAHTSGMGNSFNKKIDAPAKMRLKTIGNFLSSYKNQKLDFAPGSTWHYSNTGYLVLGKIIEIVSKKSYFDYINEHIYLPAGMLDSGSFDITKANKNLAIGYDKSFSNSAYSLSNNLFDNVIKGGPAGGGFSTVGDLLKFSLALQAGKLLKEKTLDYLITPRSLKEHYALGFHVQNRNSFGYRGLHKGISSELAIFPKSGFTAIVLSNYSLAGSIVSLKMKQLIERIK